MDQATGDDAPIQVSICSGLCCELAGSQALAGGLPSLLGGAAEAVPARCMGRCDQAPVLMIGEVALPNASPEAMLNLLLEDHEPLPGGVPAMPQSVGYENYRAAGGYALAASLIQGERDVSSILQAMDESALRGWGDAEGLGVTLRRLRERPAPRSIVVNIDAEPGSFKDRNFLEADPHRIVEGLLIGMHVADCESGAVYLRAEHEELLLALEAELALLRAHPPCALPSITVHEGEGRAQAAVACETLHAVRELVEKGAGWFNRFGRHGCTGLRAFSIAGRVAKPGVKVAPAGITLDELIEEYCGGMAPGHELFAWLPAGTWGNILPARLADVPLDHRTLGPHGCALGAAAIVVLSRHDRARCDAFRKVAGIV